MRKPKQQLKRFLQATLKTACSIIVSGFCIICGLIVCSQASFYDFFTTGQTSILKDRPVNIERDIIVDACGILNSNSGIKILTENIINGICKKRPNWRFVILCNSNIECSFNFTHKNIKVIYVNYYSSKLLIIVRDILNFVTLGMFRDQISQLLFFNNIYFNKNCALLFDPYAELITNDYSSVPKISLIHDMLYRDIPEYFGFGMNKSQLENFKSNSQKIVKYSQKLLTVSNFSKERIVKNFKVNKDFVQTIYIKLANRLKTSTSLKSDSKSLNKFKLKRKKYLIYPSAVRLRKNHIKLLQAFIKFNQKYKSDVKLVIVGEISTDQLKKMNKLIEANDKKQANNLKEKIIFTRSVSDDELNALLTNALAMIFPSIYEGFGMPLIEAMSAGIPIACSDKTSLPEIAGDAALFFDPYNIDKIFDAINTISTNKNLRAELIRRGYKRAKYFSNKNSMIDEYITVFEKYMQKP